MAGLLDFFGQYPDGIRGQYIPREGGMVPYEGKLGPEGNVYEGESSRGSSAKGAGKDVVQRNMKQVGPAMKEVYGERVPNAALEGPKGAAAAAEAAAGGGGRGLLSRLGGALLGPAGVGVQAMVQPGELADGTRRGEAGNYPEAMPGDAEAGAFYRDNLTGLMMKNIRGQMADASAPQQATQAPAQAPTPQQNVTVPQPSKPQAANVGGVIGSPGAPQQQQAMINHKIEQHRQVIEAGAIKGLADNSLSRVQAATAVVDADCQRQGIELSPKEKQEAVKQEVAGMRSMDNNDLGKYLSYALIGVGILAAATDRSGAAAGAFVAGGLSAYNAAQQRKWDQYKFMREEDRKDRGDKREDRKVDIDERKVDSGIRKDGAEIKDIDSKINDRLVGREIDRGKLANDTAQVGISQQNANTNAFSAQNSAGIGWANANTNAGRLNLESQKWSDGAELRDSQVMKNKAAAAKSQAGGLLKAGEGTTKDNTALIEQWSKANNVELGKGVKEAVAQQFAIVRKNYPAEVAKNPDKVLKDILSKYQGKSKVGLMGFGSPYTEYSIPGTAK